MASRSARSGQGELNLGAFTIRTKRRRAARAMVGLPLRSSFTCTIVSIERPGVSMPNPAAGTVPYPNNKVPPPGRDAGLRRAERWLNTEAEPVAIGRETLSLAVQYRGPLGVTVGSRDVGQ